MILVSLKPAALQRDGNSGSDRGRPPVQISTFTSLGPLAGGFLFPLFPLLPPLLIYASASAIFAAASLGLARPVRRRA